MEKDRLVGLQLGASAEDKRWSVERFVELGILLAERTGAKIVLTGGPGEDELGREFKKRFPHDVINLIGDTSLGELISLIYLLDLFISNDTGPLHIATAVGTPTINISLGAVHFRETGPYSEGDYVFKADIPCSPCGFNSGCKNNICKEKIKPELVWLVADSVLNGSELEIGDISQWEGVQLYRSAFCEDGMVDYIPQIRRSLTKEDLFLNLYRKTWIGILERGAAPNWQEEGETILGSLESYYDIDPESLLEATREEYDALKAVSDFSRSALSILDVIKREGGKDVPDPELLEELWKNVRYINQQIETVAVGRISLRPLFIVFRYGLENLSGEGIPELAASASGHYRDLLTHSEALRGFMEFFVKRYHISPSTALKFQ
ncbi:MAG: glycosyltransferase family 9 protein [Nitrospirae bacterium]|nr:MAG: glycosyltransferase family 9 protein [Nitrospirota bacterium]